MERKSILLITRDHSTMSKSQEEMHVWRKKIEMVGIDIKSIEQDVDTNRFKLKTKLMNQHFINRISYHICLICLHTFCYSIHFGSIYCIFVKY